MEFGSRALFELLNQMEALAEDEDLLFVLTTNRPDLIEPALAARPGRSTSARDPAPRCLRVPAAAGPVLAGIEIDACAVDQLVERSDGVSGAFIKEARFARPGCEPRLRTASRPPPRTCAACSTTCSKSARP